MFHEFLTQHTDEILRRCRHRLLERMVLRPTEEELAKGLPLFLGQLIESLRRYNGSMPQGPLEIGEDAARFGRDLSRLGFTVTQLVHGYSRDEMVVIEVEDESDSSQAKARESALRPRTRGRAVPAWPSPGRPYLCSAGQCLFVMPATRAVLSSSRSPAEPSEARPDAFAPADARRYPHLRHLAGMSTE